MRELDVHHHTGTTACAGTCAGSRSCAEPPASRGSADAGLSRRAVLRGVGAATLGVAAVGVLAACGADSAQTPAASGGTSGGDLPDGVLAMVADIPVGGAISATGADGKPIILSQPTAGTVVGLSAVCTHQGCTVAPDGAELVCPCHGSVFTAADGANVSGPAKTPLPAVAVTVENGEVRA
ncbi:Rieske (2Fe-2S) protein [Pengzhenrongella frigida]|uniref:Cytochrome bc1 complex Rieske iron-sulfur subunit n=1 Tax=Pengzhenrongella frigida TaxID=1259133 RepID=A0A4Q5N1G6_9MICO|nr:Rieske 2Fe-2S domain-containing protein [Cellulomonas sp. HLT2-17]RYV51113.1 Rieske (2Fe-2S) protein [Cellulomonas sp. HLT2-17]